jgi:hypothetical protein
MKVDAVRATNATQTLRDRLPPLPPALHGRHELTPLCYAIGLDPPGGRDAYRSNLARNLLLLQALDEAMAALGNAGIAVQPLKGALYVETLYGGDLGARPMTDLDLLVPVEHAERARELLQGLGYTWYGGDRARFSPRHTHHFILHRGTASIELHWKLCHELSVDPDGEDFFRDSREIHYRGRPLRVASDELQTFYLLLHAATHALLHSAVWLIDAALLARAAPSLDWDRVVHHAERRRAGRLLAAAARHANRFFPGTFPAANPGSGLRDRALERLLSPGAKRVRGRSLRSLAIRALLTERPGDAASALLGKALLRMRESVYERRGTR